METESGLLVPAEVERERRDERKRVETLEEIERRRKQPKDKLIRSDGKLRKGRHTSDIHRKRANRKSGLKGITGA